MAVTQRTTPQPVPTTEHTTGASALSRFRTRRARLLGPGMRPLASPGQIAVIYRWATWALALGLIVTGASTTYGNGWARRGDVYLLLGLTLLVNVLLTFALRPYIRLMRRFPVILVLDVFFCLAVYADSNIWTSPFQFYSYAALMLPVTIFFYGGALAGSLLFLVLDVILLYHGGYTLAQAAAGGYADTYLMQLAIVPLLAFVFAYPNRLYAQLRRAQQRLDQVEREQLLATERTRIAQSLHDSVAQMLFGIGMLAESALVRLAGLGTSAARGEASSATAGEEARGAEERDALAGALGQVRDLAARGNQEMRRAIYALHEPIPARRGLATALRALLSESAARIGLDTHLTVVTAGANGDEQAADATDAAKTIGLGAAMAAGSGEPAAPADSALAGERVTRPVEALPGEAAPDELAALPEPISEALYKVAREALANVEKHALAFNVWVEVTLGPTSGHTAARQVELMVRDDGQGFRRPLLSPLGVPDEDEDGLIHFGTSNMRRDMEAIGGKIEITSAPGRGTSVRAVAPLTA